MAHAAQATAQQRTELLARQLLQAEKGVLQLAPTAGQQQAALEAPTYSIALPEKLTPDGPWSVYRSASSPFQLVSTYPPPADHVRTLYDNLEYAAAKYPHMPYLGTRKRDDKGRLGSYTWMTYAQSSDVRTAIGSGLLQLGLQPKAGVGIYSVNSKEWLLFDSALHAYSMISVPLYDTLGPDAVEFIANHAELAAVGVSAAVLPTLLTCLPKCPGIRVLVVWGATGPLPEPPAGVNCRLVTLDAVEQLGRRHPRAHLPPKPSDIATLCYTSGTTGQPKGAVLTHGNLIANAAGTSTLLPESAPGDRHLSYLPLAHIYERVNIVLLTHLGNAIGFYSGNVQELLDDVVTLKPQIFVSVPRLWNRIHDRVMLAVQTGSPLARALFERAYAHKKASLARGDPVGGRWGRLYDRLVFSKIRAKLGGELKYMISGASPISEEVMSFLRICFGATVLEGYGMTEAACTISTTRSDDLTTGHVGAPNPAVEVKLVDLPEMGYTSRDSPYPRGEICVRGPSIFAGYYKDEVQTREVLDQDGWLHTGDVGAWLEGGRLKIIDRKKNIFKLAQGEYIAPEKIENAYGRSPMVLQAFVYGDSLRSQLVAIVVPDPEVLLPWAKDRGIEGSLEQLCENPHVVDAVLRSMQEQAREAQLRGFEQVHSIHLHPEAFTVENDLLTPTFKLKRPQAKTRFQEHLDAMYAQLPSTA
ncbi:hypothetical protein PLESTB_000909900 [Pleodorina starrii]|uniref:Long-chain-fatty-acid--CoA ligase n=1 Tax=Pleodorina starrii TaxID=330485 RepID=A0A9W6F3U3_9CHLO|nr:hypothetical protein PLESTM_001521400 [Pleodorina starrii]GLC54825.1 hypothetical protein PLESTB_000909900 [Pleodorina starrii]GLC73730.1 hypothetical protein PLESTF_001413100 [Pleodorina starrii]